MDRKPFNQFIIISGSGKKVGKTYMATALIRAFSNQFPLIALKISPHEHDSLGNIQLIAKNDGIRIFRDLEVHAKNSGQFLNAGAAKSFFMETDDVHLSLAFDIFMERCNPANQPVICESGALSDLIKPGILIFITRSADHLPEHKLATLSRADLVLPAESFFPSVVISKIRFSENRWHILPD